MQQLSRNKRSIVSFRLLIKDNMNFSKKKNKKRRKKMIKLSMEEAKK